MSLKTVWDYAYYWGVLGLLFFNHALTDIDLLSKRNEALQRIRKRHMEVQNLFTEMAKLTTVEPTANRFTNHAAMELMQTLNSALADKLSLDDVGRQLDANLIMLEELAQEIELLAENANGISATGKVSLVPELADFLNSDEAG